MEKLEPMTEQIDEGLLYWKPDPQGDWIVGTYDYVLKRYVKLHNIYTEVLKNYAAMSDDYNKMLVNARLENLERKI